MIWVNPEPIRIFLSVLDRTCKPQKTKFKRPYLDPFNFAFRVDLSSHWMCAENGNDWVIAF